MRIDSPLVSIILPSYNCADYAAQLCDSILGQTYQQFEVLILDDGSKDGTAEVCSSYCKDPRFQFFRWNDNRGAFSATLALLQRASGSYWCSPGTDDILEARFLEKRVGAMEANPQAAMIHGPAHFIDSKGATVPAMFPVLQFPLRMEGSSGVLLLLQHNFVSAPSVLLRMSLTRMILPFYCRELHYAYDWYSWILHLATGFDLLWDPEVLHRYRVHSQSLSLHPAKAALRTAEIAIAPLCALGSAAQFSSFALKPWVEWRKTLYHVWLLRALKLHWQGSLRQSWLEQAAAAFYNKSRPGVSLHSELVRHGLGALLTRQAERKARSKLTFPISGIAQISHDIFK